MLLAPGTLATAACTVCSASRRIIGYCRLGQLGGLHGQLVLPHRPPVPYADICPRPCRDKEPSTPAAGPTLGPTSGVPVGGGTVYPQERVVVTQPAAGTFHAFSAVCTHQGCTLKEVVGDTINCPCHGSKFDVNDGSVVHGPAQQPLGRLDVTVQAGTLRLT